VGEVKVYLWDGDCTECGGGAYFMEQPMSTVGDWLRISEEHAVMVGEATLQRWRETAEAMEAMQVEIAGLLGNHRRASSSSTERGGP
jgi:hypothetical protein